MSTPADEPVTAQAAASGSGEPAATTNGLHSNKSGWDGKLRLDKNKKAVLANPEALSDPDYSDEDAPPVDQIEADEDLLQDEDPDVEEIDLQHSRVSSIPNLRLERFSKVIKLCLRQNSISSIQLPESLAATLQELELYDNLISHVKGLESFTELRSLDLSYNKIKHIKRVDHLNNLHHLYFVQNKISRIEGLDGLSNLTYLELGANRIREITGLETLVNLDSLWLGQNKITELKGLSTLTKLKTLSIQANRITSLDGLKEIPQLEELYISDNLLTSLEPLSHAPELKILDVQNNPITSLRGVSALAHIENLWATGCKLESFNELEKELGDKKELSEVYFEATPLQKSNPVLYRNKVRLALPQVSKIDATYVRV
ncbi:L domain-like protein [Aureobasidium namibiae CBS 147.97]|uniref:L domain-like protein n=1 Tax=Aureobasidium namibiae CBS 147.97 TaxID=1043004 RepID=A0A074WHC4_9PEZI